MISIDNSTLPCRAVAVVGIVAVVVGIAAVVRCIVAAAVGIAVGVVIASETEKEKASYLQSRWNSCYSTMTVVVVVVAAAVVAVGVVYTVDIVAVACSSCLAVTVLLVVELEHNLFNLLLVLCRINFCLNISSWGTLRLANLACCCNLPIRNSKPNTISLLVLNLALAPSTSIPTM